MIHKSLQLSSFSCRHIGNFIYIYSWMGIAVKRTLNVVLLMSIVTLMSGCSTKYHVHINGFLDAARAQAITPDACILIVEDEENDNPIFYSEVKHKIEMLLTSKGNTICPPESADYQLLFGYGMDSGRTIRGTRMIHEPSHIVTIRRSNSKGGHSYSNIHIPGSTYSVPYSETIFGHWLTLYLYDAPKTEKALVPSKPLWIGEITSNASSSDLREMINPMLVAAFDHFGANTHKRIKEIIVETDPRVKQLAED